ncbi:MAG: hypothetical protein ACKV1O_07350 [Saprospiraceae bacterium]
MRISTYLTAIAVLFFSGISEIQAQMPAQTGESTLLDVPIPPHNRNVETYFSGESRPAKSYLHLKYLSAKKTGHDDLNQLVLDLKKQAQASGADAIIVLETQKTVNEFFSDGHSGIVETATMDALAVVYPENLKFIPGSVKAWKVHLPGKDGQTWQLAATQEFNFMEQPASSTGTLKWIGWLKKWNHAYLLERPELVEKVIMGDFNREKKRVLVDNRTVRLYYKPNSTNKKIEKLKIATSNVNEQTVYYHYTPDGEKVASREMIFDYAPKTRYFEYPEFDENGNVKGYLYLKQEGEKKEQFLRLDYDFYTEEDWNAHVKALVVAELGE